MESVASNSADAIGDAYEAKAAPVKKSVKRAAKKPVKAVKSVALKPDVTKEVKKLSKHIGLIEGEVSEITKRYEELKIQKQEEPSDSESL